MESLAYLGALIPLAGIGVVVLFIIAVIQQSKHEQAGGLKQAFFTVVSLVMLSITVGSIAAILTLVSKEYVFTEAVSDAQRYNSPPALYLEGVNKTSTPAAYTCESDCQFSANDKTQFSQWKQEYRSWKSTPFQPNNDFRRNLVGPLAFLIVGLPLYLIFMRLMEKGAKQEREQLSRPTSLRQLYCYFVAFSGLLIMVLAGGFLINTGLRVMLNTDSDTVSTPIAVPTTETISSADSVIACADQCGFSDSDVELVKDWKSDMDTYQANIEKPRGQTQNDLASTIPLILVGAPLFWYHFSLIRKELQTTKKPTSESLPPHS